MPSFITCVSAPAVNDIYFPMDVDDVSVPSTEYEIFNPGFLIKRCTLPFFFWPSSDDVQHSTNILSDVFTCIKNLSTKKIRLSSKEEYFIMREGLQEAVKVATSCIAKIFGSDVETSMEHCKDPEGSDLEWLDINLYFRDVEDSAIEELLQRVDELDYVFEEEVGIAKAADINFYLDIR